MKTLIIITLIYGGISCIFLMFGIIKFILFKRKTKNLFANYYSLTTHKEIKQKQREILNEFLNGSFDLRKKYQFFGFIYKILIFVIIICVLCLYISSIWNLSILLVLFLLLFCTFIVTFYIFLFQKMSNLFYLYIKNNNFTSINFKKASKNILGISPFKNIYIYIILPLMMSISFLILLIILAYLDGA
ncbi:hypothetical protein MPD5_1670 (plasmid) [Melissococcus plutonius DAT561]|uniref:Uncharacterized protein n=1 Tax=Melissococcus plutonius TaxID=33970 RepID=A0A2Z5Y4V7_9ENTE|nr:hypothetical protein MPD5_1670 [Melissococcus plutonius DAT561]BBC61831.1 hypothetical protein DAT561_p1131 [Melissococcus plutonius]